VDCDLHTQTDDSERRTESDSRVMSLLRTALILGLALLGGAVVVAAPVFATPNITASSGSRSVAPFITPIGNTSTSTLTGASTDFSFTGSGFGGTRFTVTCADSSMGGHVVVTHTRALLTAVAMARCNAGTFTIATSASSTTPWPWHVRTVGSGSATGSIEIPAGGSLTITAGGGACTVVVTPQSIDVTFTDAATSLVVSDNSIVYTVRGIGPGCPVSRSLLRFTGVFTFRLSTANDQLAVTSAS
jgi:hypothetical protein